MTFIIIVLIVCIGFLPKYGLFWCLRRWRQQRTQNPIKDSGPKLPNKDEELEGVALTTLQQGEEGRVVGLAPSCQGLARRRFQDLGLTPGAQIKRVMQSAFREPTAYRVRNTLIALRREQSDMIRGEREKQNQ